MFLTTYTIYLSNGQRIRVQHTTEENSTKVVSGKSALNSLPQESYDYIIKKGGFTEEYALQRAVEKCIIKAYSKRYEWVEEASAK